MHKKSMCIAEMKMEEQFQKDRTKIENHTSATDVRENILVKKCSV